MMSARRQGRHALLKSEQSRVRALSGCADTTWQAWRTPVAGQRELLQSIDGERLINRATKR